MTITGFQPLIVSQNADALIRLFEDLGFEKDHEKKGLNDQDISNVTMKDARGNRVDITKGAEVPRDLMAIRMNTDNFPEAFHLLSQYGFRNAQGYRLIQTSTSTDALMISPSGAAIVLSQHIKK